MSADLTPREPPNLRTEAAWEPYREDLRDIYDRIFELRDGQPTIVRAMDLYLPVLAPLREAGIGAECLSELELFSAAVHRVAEEYGVPTASMLDEFNGPGHDQDPAERGLIGSDGIHTSAAGQAVMVDVLDSLGYEPVEQG
jgi:lysophospholipase L1-like esterase